jgi:hypothetical protein
MEKQILKKITAIILITIIGITGVIAGLFLYILFLRMLDKVAAFYRLNPFDNTYSLFIIASIILVFLAFYRIKWQYDLSRTTGSIEQMNGRNVIDFLISCVFTGSGLFGLIYSLLIVYVFIIFGRPLPY